MTFTNTGKVVASDGATAVSVESGSFTLDLSGAQSNIDGTVSVSDKATASIKATATKDDFVLNANKLTEMVLDDGAQLTLGGDASEGTKIQQIQISSDSSLAFDGDRTVVVTDGGSFLNEGNFKASALVLDETSKKFENKGTIEVDTFDLAGDATSGTTEIGGTIRANERITYHGIGGNAPSRALTATLETPLLQIKSDYTGWSGVAVSDSKVLEKVQNIELDSTGATRISFYLNGDVDVQSNITLLGDGESQIEVNEGSSAHLTNVTSKGTKGKLQINGSGTLSVDNLVVEGPAVNLELTGGTHPENGALYNLSQITVKDGSRLNVAVYGTGKPDVTIDGDLNINLGADAVVDFGAVKNSDWLDNKIFIKSPTVTVNVADSDNPGSVYLAQKGTDLENTTVTVKADGSNNTGDAQADLQKLVNVVQLTSKDSYEANLGDVADKAVVEGAILVQEASDVLDGANGVVSTDASGEATVTDIQAIQNANVYGVAEMAVIGLNIWRNEINDMNKRLGELRDSASDSNGLWARVYQNRSEYGSLSVESKHTAVQLGYDRQLLTGASSQGWLGAAFSYTDIDSDFNSGNGEGNLYALTVYGSWLHDNGAFVDLTAKVGRMKNEFTTWQNATVSTGDYHANAYSVSAEFGWRFYRLRICSLSNPRLR